MYIHTHVLKRACFRTYIHTYIQVCTTCKKTSFVIHTLAYTTHNRYYIHTYVHVLLAPSISMHDEHLDALFFLLQHAAKRRRHVYVQRLEDVPLIHR